MLKRLLVLMSTLALALGVTSCNVEQTDEGDMPETDSIQAEERELTAPAPGTTETAPAPDAATVPETETEMEDAPTPD